MPPIIFGDLYSRRHYCLKTHKPVGKAQTTKMPRKFKDNRVNVRLIIALMAVVAIVVGSSTLTILYNAAYKQQKQRLVEIAQIQARILEEMMRTTANRSNRRSNSIENVISQLRSAYSHFEGIGSTGELALAKLQDNNIQFLFASRQNASPETTTVPKNSKLAEPMRLALAGQSGVVIAQDYSGETVLAAYEPIGQLQLGIVAKINMAEFRSPFIQAGLISAGTGLILIIVGTFCIFRLSVPILREVEENKSYLKTIVDSVIDGIITIDNNNIIQSINPSATKMFGYNENELFGKNMEVLIPQKYKMQHKALLQEFSSTEQHKISGISRELKGIKKDGSLFPIEIAISETQIENRTLYTSVIRDVTLRKKSEKELHQHREILEEQVAVRTKELAEANKKLKVLARSDGLTGIANRRVFDEELTLEIRRSARSQSMFSLLICDIDFFKNYNDSYGHPQGDLCLQQVASVINRTFQRAGELVARYGGEEFAIILPRVNEIEVFDLADQLRQKVWDLNIPHRTSKIATRVSISVGAATFIINKVKSNEQIIKIADDALYKAKKNGRNRVETTSLKLKGSLSSVSTS